MATAANPSRFTDAPSGRRRSTLAPRPLRLLVATCAILGACLAWTAVASAAPANDAFAAATPITDLPFSGTVDMTGAGTETDEPQFCFFSEQTAWYAVTPTRDGSLAARATGSTSSAQITAYSSNGSGLGGLTFLSCQNFGSARAVFEVQAGQTYYLQAAVLFGTGGTLSVDVEEQLPPPNDDFANGTPVGSVPFSGAFDLTAATVQDGEPTTCQGSTSQATAWYAFSPSQSGSYIVSRSGYGPISAYTGSSLSGLTQVACGTYQTIFRAEAGTTYHLQVASSGFGFGSAEQLSIDHAPPAQASFFYSPFDPSVFDTVAFFDFSNDTAGIASRTWTLTDGFTSTAASFGHRFAADGSYDATLAIQTTDGRTASHTLAVPVKTHDVAITGLTVPAKARAGRTKPIAVAVNNSRYAETVQVSIQRSVPGGAFEEVGQVTQRVPARAARRTTSFQVSYTFSEEDAAFGKVTFKAVATLVTARDANPSDNTVIAPATRVTG